jgi:hypothetical protein
MNDSGKDGRSPPPARRLATRVVTAGRDPKSYHGFVNPHARATRCAVAG